MSEPARSRFTINTLQRLLLKLRAPFVPSGGPHGGAARPGTKDVDAERLRVQVDVIRRAFEEAGLRVTGAPAGGATPPRDDADVHYLYRPGHVLARSQDVGRLEEYFASDGNHERFRGELSGSETRVPDLTLVSLPSRRDGRDDVLATLEELERDGVVEPGVLTPDHVVYVTGKGYMCPATEPEVPRRTRTGPAPWPAPVQPIARVARDEQVRVAVVDTGLWTAATDSEITPWLRGVVADPSDEEVVDPSKIHAYAGHGTFVAGVVRCLAPTARVEVEGVLTHGGAVYESEIVEQLHEAINDDHHPQIISISAGTHTRGDFASLGFAVLGERNELGERDDILIVAAAGNDASDKPFWPAAFGWVVSVGSVDQTGKVSDFSNTGPWVDVYARGRNLVNAFPKGTYTCYEPPNVGQVRTFDGLAQWSGTSFATPLVTGMVAARMQAEAESPAQAWSAIRSGGTSVTDQRAGAITRVGPLS